MNKPDTDQSGNEDSGKLDQVQENLCQTCKAKPGTPRIDKGLSAGTHCDECWEEMITSARQQSW